MSPKKLLIVGSGSVGRRHLQNFANLGAQVAAMDPSPARLAESAEKTPLIGQFTSLEQALDNAAFDAAVICSPPSLHVEQTRRCMDARLACLVEKPLGIDAASVAPLVALERTAQVPLLLGYTYRWWQPLIDMRAAVVAGRVGKPLHVRCVMSAHLADWHPWERYQSFFMAHAALGGGALLDESHFLDLMLWFFGMPASVQADIGRSSSLEIDTDDNVDALLRYESGLRVSIHLDLYGRPHEKSITIAGDEGTLLWTFDPNVLRTSHRAEAIWETRHYELERNDMFVGVAREFLGLLAGKGTPTCTLADGARVLAVIDAMRASATEGRRVPLGSAP
jgi:predicted dehydrogenase